MDDPSWGVAKRIAFRWAFVFGAVTMFPFPIGVFPKMSGVAEALGKPLEWATTWFAHSALGLPDVASEFNGSGDRSIDYAQLLLFAILGVVGASVWSILDRRRTAYPRLARGAWVMLRCILAYSMLSYGFSKLVKAQFPDPYPAWLYQRVGDSSPMRLLWTFMGYSAPYTVFAGLAETVGGILLLWRRTTTLGALVVIVVMTNVVMLNFCYDVPVKLYSTQLLVMAGLIAMPAARRLFAALIGHATAEVAPRPRMSRRAERARIVVKVALLASMAIQLYPVLTTEGRTAHSELRGNWIVDSFTADGVELPPLTTDPVRWQAWTVHSSHMIIWLMNDQRERPVEPSDGYYPFELDPAKHTVTVTVDEAKKTRETWTYSRPDPDHLVVDGMHLGHPVHVVLHLWNDSLLMTRGFHWINEVPFNR